MGDAAIDFPAALSELAGPPSDIAVDANGHVWFVMFQYDGKSNGLYEYDPGKDAVSTVAIPSSSGSELHSAIAVDSRGHVLVGDGDTIVDFDRASERYSVTALPTPIARADPLPGYTGTFITDMAVDQKGHAYLSRMNAAAITEIDLGSGGVREIPFPASFRPVYDIALSGDDIWMTTWFDLVDKPSETGVLNVSTGAFEAVPVKTSALAAAAQGAYGTSLNSPGLLNTTREHVSAVVSPNVTDSLQGLSDFVATDPKTGAVWMTGDSRPTIARYEPESGLARAYALPRYTSHIYSRGCTEELCPSVGEIRTAVRGLAVAPNGDVYFSDATRNRIGVIHAER
jgi:streptogramin lyase